MITIYIFLVISLGLLVYGLYDYSKKDNRNRNKLQQGYSHAEYLGGSPHFNTTSQGYMRPTKTALVFTHNDKYIKPFSTNWNNIKSLKVKTHEQITNDITLGRVLTLGVFALAAKKQNVHTKQYLVIHCEEEGVNYDMLFTGEGMGALASRINKALIDYRKANVSITQIATN